MTSIARDDVVKAARLARVHLSDDEATRVAGDLERVVGYIEQLMAVDVSGVEPMVQPAPNGPPPLPRRADEPGDVIGRAALQGSAGYDDGLVRVPKVIE